MIKFKNLVNGLVRYLIVDALLSLTIVIEVAPAVEAAPGGPGGGGGRAPIPSAGLTFLDMDKIFSPAVGTPGQEITYSLRLVCDPVASNWGARNAVIRLPLYSTQKFVRFNPQNTGWTM